MTGTVSAPATVSASAAAQSLASTRYDLTIGTLTAGLTWAGASFELYIDRGQFATVPSVTATDAAGAALAVTATGTISAASGSATSKVSYVISGALAADAVLHFSGIYLSDLAAASRGSDVRIIAVANGAGSLWRRYANWQTLATVGSTSVTPESGWWWSAAESGRGYAIEVAEGRLMLAAYMYRDDGTSVWYVANGAVTGGVFSGALTEFAGGGTLAGAPQAPTGIGDVASVTITFSSATAATLTWNGAAFAGAPVTSALSRYSFTGSSAVTPAAASDAPETGWYWNAEEAGTGWYVEVQGSEAFLAVYLYAADGTSRWYAAQGTLTRIGGVFGAAASFLFEAALTEYGGGQTLTSGARVGLTALPQGMLTLQFTSSGATATLPGGRTLALTRFSGF